MNSTRSAPGVGVQATRLDISELGLTAKGYFMKGLADSTQRDYQSSQNRFLAFCRQANYKAVPASETVLCHFVSYMAKQKLKHKTINVYFSAIHFLHISEGAGGPFHPSLDPLQYILRGIKRVEAYSRSERRGRLPISPNTLRKVKTVWEA